MTVVPLAGDRRHQQVVGRGVARVLEGEPRAAKAAARRGRPARSTVPRTTKHVAPIAASPSRWKLTGRSRSRRPPAAAAHRPGAREQRAEHDDRGADLLDELGRRRRREAPRRTARQIDSSWSAAQWTRQPSSPSTDGHGVDVADARDVGEPEHALGEQARRHLLQHGVLRPARGDRPGERASRHRRQTCSRTVVRLCGHRHSRCRRVRPRAPNDACPSARARTQLGSRAMVIAMMTDPSPEGARPQPRPGARPRRPRRPPWPPSLDGPRRQERRRRRRGQRDAHRALLACRWTASSSSARARRTRPRCSSTASASATARPPHADIAVDPIDGTTLDRPGPQRRAGRHRRLRAGRHVRPGPVRLHGEDRRRAPGRKGACDIRKSPTENLHALSDALEQPVRDLIAVILDRPRHDDLIDEVRQRGARIRLITDGDVAGAISTGWPGAGTRHPLRHRRHPRGRHRRRRAQVHGRRDPGSPVAPRRGRAHAPRRSRLRPRQGAHDRRPRRRATTASSPPPASPTASCSAACGSTSSARRPSSLVMRSKSGTVRKIDGVHRARQAPGVQLDRRVLEASATRSRDGRVARAPAAPRRRPPSRKLGPRERALGLLHARSPPRLVARRAHG